MNFIKKLFSFKKVATLIVKCALPYNGEAITFNIKCNFYENKHGERITNLNSNDFPLYYALKGRELLERFLSNEIIIGIPSYKEIKEGIPPAIITDYTCIIV